MTNLELSNITLQKLCEEQGEPYRHITSGGFDGPRKIRTIDAPMLVNFHRADMYCGRVRDVVVFGKSYVTDQPGRGVFLGQSHRDYNLNAFAQSYVEEIVAETRQNPLIEEECCFLGGAKPFGHFIFEYLYRLPAFDVADLSKRLPVILFDDFPEEWVSFLELYGVPPQNIFRIPRYPAVRFKSVWIAPCPNALGRDRNYRLWDDGIHKLRNTLRANALQDNHPPGPKRLFLGRKGAAHRRLLNEDALWEMLAAREFERADFVGLSAAEQVRLVANAQLIVSVVGSASPITSFAPDNCTIIEIRPPNVVGALGSFGFAVVIGQRLNWVESKILAWDSSKPPIDQDTEVDIDSVRDLVDRALKP